MVLLPLFLLVSPDFTTLDVESYLPVRPQTTSF